MNQLPYPINSEVPIFNMMGLVITLLLHGIHISQGPYESIDDSSGGMARTVYRLKGYPLSLQPILHPLALQGLLFIRD
jgi:hypothetical protein